jgi:WD40 repeat protein
VIDWLASCNSPDHASLAYRDSPRLKQGKVMRSSTTTIVSISILLALAGCGRSSQGGSPGVASVTSGTVATPNSNTPSQYSGPTQHNGAVFDIHFSADGTTLRSVGADGLVLQWDVASGKVTAQIQQIWQGQNASPAWALLADGGSIVVGENLNEIDAWDVTTGTHLYTLTPGALAATLSSDGTLLGVPRKGARSPR